MPNITTEMVPFPKGFADDYGKQPSPDVAQVSGNSRSTRFLVSDFLNVFGFLQCYQTHYRWYPQPYFGELLIDVTSRYKCKY